MISIKYGYNDYRYILALVMRSNAIQRILMITNYKISLKFTVDAIDSLCYTDQVDPTITCPSDITVFPSQVSWNAPNANDDLDTMIDIECTPSSGSTFAVDQTSTVTCTATDNAGNSVECTFMVTVGRSLMASCTSHLTAIIYDNR